jgi:SAM-dependent methyltransferase
LNRINPVAAAGFASGAELYERARPSYPAEAVGWLVERTGMGAGSVVADVGAGTGKLTRLLLSTGARVVAVEPLAEMRALIEGAEVVDGTAEELPFEDESVDVITAAQSFHWFDYDRALPELHRVLRPDGFLVLVWNGRDLEDPLQLGIEELLSELRAEVPDQQLGRWREPLRTTPFFGNRMSRSFPYVQWFTADDLAARVASTSFVAALPPVEREELLVRVRALAHGRPEPFPFPYKTDVHIVPRTRDAA